MSFNQLHKNFCSQSTKLSDWYCSKLSNLEFPIYSSYDIRDAGFKISNVDANIYPAGFNNICPTDKESAVSIVAQYLDRHYGSSVSKIMLVTEEHTNNPYYWENVWTIQNLLQSAGKKVLIGFPSRLAQPMTLKSSTEKEMHVVSAFGDSQEVKDFAPDLIISNNDFSQEHLEWSQSVGVPINPPRELGWYQRQKSRYFENYNQIVNEFAEIAKVDPFQMRVETEVFSGFEEEGKRELLADRVDAMISKLKLEYSKRNIIQQPFVFVKNNAGTYGLAVIRVGSGAEIRDWNYKSRKKMKAAKGGRDVDEVIIQEGIPSVVKSEGSSAEPVIYMLGRDLAGGFLRTHAGKSDTDSLNSPGAVYKRLCVSDLNASLEGSPLENVYGWSARLGLMAIAQEAQQMNVKFEGYKK